MTDVYALTDRLGDEFMATVPASVRRETGSTYTPWDIVMSMVREAADSCDPDIIVDCGCGSGRFALAAALVFPHAKVYAVDSSSRACAMCAENVSRHGLADRVKVVCSSFMDFSLPSDRGKVLWIGNPPYVRHHQIDAEDKDRFKWVADSMHLPASGLAGLHIHFIAHIARQWQEGDFGMLVTSAEWMDVNYGSFVRGLLTDRLPLVALRLFDRSVRLFEGTDSTAVIFSFSDARRSSARVTLPDGETLDIPIGMLKASPRWSQSILRPKSVADVHPADLVPLGSIASVHRGVVTGNNKFWVRSGNDLDGIPATLTVPVVSHAREIMDGCVAKGQAGTLSRLITLPNNLETLSGNDLQAAKRIFAEGTRRGIDQGYVARSRRCWWSITPSAPPAIMMTYMARRSPKFVRNDLNLSMLNVVHGIYPKQELSDRALSRLITYLNNNVSMDDGRIYCGGLAKFEPKEAEALLVPRLELLEG